MKVWTVRTSFNCGTLKQKNLEYLIDIQGFTLLTLPEFYRTNFMKISAKSTN